MCVQRRLLPPATTATRDYGNRSTHGLFGWARARRAGSGVHVGLAPRVRGTYLSRRLGDPDVEVRRAGAKKSHPSHVAGTIHAWEKKQLTTIGRWEPERWESLGLSSLVIHYPMDRVIEQRAAMEGGWRVAAYPKAKRHQERTRCAHTYMPYLIHRLKRVRTKS